MGAGQSADGSRSSREATQDVKTSYYALLDIDKQATDDEIKKAYRRKALELHPDRNYGDVERTTALFVAIQSAYQVLSDPQERAWYDAHEDAILRDIDPTASSSDPSGANAYEHNVGLATADDVTRLLRRFHGGVEYTDTPSGFYGFLRDFFAQLAKEEVNAALRQSGGNEPPDYPSFGHAADTYEDVARPFYGAWAGFSTCKTFAWRDQYRASEGEDRRMRRLIDKENMRCRREGIQEFNDAVRALVAFVRKRDPRYQAAADTRSEGERQKVLREAAQAQAARMRRRNEEMISGSAVPEWVRTRASGTGEEDELEGKLGESSSSEEEHFECMACRKTFKSERQFEAHEKSKKHVKAVEALRRKLEKEGHVFGVDEEEAEDEEDDAGENETDGAAQDGVEERGSPDVAKGSQPSAKGDQVNGGHDSDDTVKDDQMKQDGIDHPSQHDLTNGKPTNAIHDDNDRKNKSPTITPVSAPTTSAPSLSPSPSDDLTAHTAHLDLSGPPLPSITSHPPNPPAKKGAAAQKRAKRAAAQAAGDDGSEETKHRCTVCAAGFHSKTRLFQHVKEWGHARAPDGGTGSGGGKKGKRKG